MLTSQIVSSELENKLGNILNENIQIASNQKLNIKEYNYVVRINIKNNRSNPNSLVLKYINPLFLDEGGWLRISFLEEHLNYKFLTEIRDLFPLYPQLIGSSEGLLVLEDLGEDIYEYPSQKMEWESVATTLAMLHGATANHSLLYYNLRKSFQLEDVHHVQENQNQLFDLAIKNLKEYCEIFNIKINNYDVRLNEIKFQINNPGEFLAFIHNDLAALRQTVSKEGNCYLLDYEWATYSHALLDISILMIGKIEKNIDSKAYSLSFLNYLPNFIDTYRTKLEKIRQMRFDDQIWQISVSSALIYNTFLVIGQLLIDLKSPSQKKLTYSYTSCLNAVLSRLLSLLEDNDSHSELKEIFRQLIAKIYF